MPINFNGPALDALINAVNPPAIVQPAQKPQKGIGPWPYLAMAAGNAADLGTTVDALSSGAGREGNPALNKMGTPGIAAAKIGGTIGIGLLMKQLSKTHPKLASALGYGEGAAMAGVAAHNYAITH